jgi:hypothetical protein
MGQRFELHPEHNLPMVLQQKIHLEVGLRNDTQLSHNRA